VGPHQFIAANCQPIYEISDDDNNEITRFLIFANETKAQTKRELLRLLVACLFCRWQSSLLCSERFFPVHIGFPWMLAFELNNLIFTVPKHSLSTKLID